MFQFFLNLEDDAIEELLLKLTLLSRSEIDAALEMHKRNPGARHAQEILARAVTTLVHGADAVDMAAKISQALFGDSGTTDMSEEEAKTLIASAPSCEVSVGALLVDVLVASKLASSKREARQFMVDGAVALNGETMADEKRALEDSDFTHRVALLKRGKRNVCVLTLS